MLYGKSLDCKHGSLQTKNRSRPFSTTKKHLLKRMNFSQTVIGLHVCYNQEILVNNAADHKQICVIYETVYFSFGGGGVGGGGSGAIYCTLLA
jgi:hypothetical protein